MIHRGTDIKAARRSRQRGFLLNPHRFGSAPFSPLSLPGLAGWYDSSDSATRTLVSGKVSQWADKSGNARHATQATAGLRYTHSAASVNGLDAFVSSGNGGMNLPGAITLGTGTHYAFVVGGANRETPFLTTTTNDAFALDISAGGTMYVWGIGGSYVTLTGLGAATSNGSVNLFGSAATTTGALKIFNATDDAHGFYPGSLGISSITNYDFGAGSYRLDGTICEVILGDSLLTATQIAIIKAYLKAKWGTP